MRSRCGSYQTQRQLEVGRPLAAAARSAAKATREGRPVRPARRGRRHEVPAPLRPDRRARPCASSSLRRAERADARQQLQHAEAGDAVARILGQAQHGQQVLDVRRIEEFEPAELHERDVAARQLDLERPRCGARRGTAPPAPSAPARPRGAPARARPRSAPDRLRRGTSTSSGLLGRGRRSDHRFLVKPLRGQRDHRVGGREDRLGRAIVPLQRDRCARPARTAAGSRGCCAPWRRGTNRSTGRRRRPRSAPRPSGFSASRIEACSRLVSWYSSTSTWSKRAPMCCGQRAARRTIAPSRAAGRRNRARAAAAWPRHRRRTGRLSSAAHIGAPGKWPLQHLVQRRAGVDRARIDRRGRCPCCGKRAVGLGEAELVPHQVHQVGRSRSRSWMVKAGSRPICARHTRAAAVRRCRGRCRPSAAPAALTAALAPRSAARRCARRGASSRAAARREKVSSRMRRGSAPLTTRCATRCASVLVLPEPAPAMTSSGREVLLPRAPAAASAPCSDRRALRLVEGRRAQPPAARPRESTRPRREEARQALHRRNCTATVRPDADMRNAARGRVT